MHQQHRRQPRAIAVAAPAPYARPGHLVIAAALAVLALLLFSHRAHAGLFGGPDSVKAQAGLVRISVADVSDGKARFYSFKSGGKDVRFFVLKSRDGVIRAAFDACDVCYHAKKGYAQQGETMVCNNCGMRFASNRVNEVKGGCNPSPLARTVDGGHVVIREADLKTGAQYF